MNKIAMLTATLLVSQIASADWYFRGTPNSWGATALDDNGDGTYSTCQTFENGDGGGGPRFKIDRFGDWSQNYPSSDYSASSNTSLNITFNSNNNSISTVNVANCDGIIPVSTWYFRGTANDWGTTAMTAAGNDIYELEVTFNGEDSNARFKIDHHGDWSENYPNADVVVDDFNSYEITFNATTKVVSVSVISGPDTQAPNATATPAAGTYKSNQSVTLNVSDNKDANPSLYFTTNGTQPTTTSAKYSGQAIAANDNGSGTDLTIRTLAVDATGNEAEQTFDYVIDPSNPISTDFRSETIYFVMTARFYDGDESNNYYNRDRIEPNDPHWRGDFKGLIQHLDYIKDLGFTAIWVTPPVENRSGLDYHGYHAYDWNKVDPRLESTDATYQDFIDAAHAKDLKVVQDVVINHSSQYGIRDQVWIDHLPIKYFVESGAEQGEMNNGPYLGNLGDYKSANRDDNDNSAAPTWFRNRHNSDPQGIIPLTDPTTGVTVPKPGWGANRFFGIDALTLDPDWYHLDGFMAGGDWENPTSLQRKHMAGDTIDLATENQNVKDYINAAMHMYLDMGVDAIRLDTAKHIERDELLTYIQDWQNHKPGTFVFGEVLVKGLGFGSELGSDNGPAEIRPWWYTRTGSNPSSPTGDSNLAVLDFPLFSTFRDNVTKGSLGGVGGALSMDWTYADPTELVTFFQNHDLGPDNDFKYRFGGSEANAALAYNLLWTIRGIPTLYYGEEIMFKAGFPHDIQSNDDTVADTGRAYYGEHLDNKATTQAHPLYQHIKRLNQIRTSIPALQMGQMESVNEWGSGMSFVRNYNNAESYAVVGLATGGQNISVSGIPNGTYRDAVTGHSINVSNGSISFNVSSNSIGVYVLNGAGKIGSNGTYLR